MSRNVNKAKVYVGDLGSGGSKPELEKEFERYGPLKSVWVARNPPGFAFIEFEDPRDAEEAVRDMDGRRVCDVRIRVEIAKAENKRSGGYDKGDRGDRGYDKGDRGFDKKSPRRGRSRSPRPKYASPDRRRSRSPRRRSRSPGRIYR